MRDAAAARGGIRTRVLGVAVAAFAAALVITAASAAQPVDDTCSKVSPSASFCIGLQKLAEAAAAECRQIGRPQTDCKLPIGHQVADDITKHYGRSWLHRAAVFQSQIGDPLPFVDAQWLGTHNSFNSPNDGFSASHTDSNQQLSMRQQLDIDMRSLELDLHWLKGGNADGSNAVVVCHGRGPDQANAGCTNEPRLKQVLPEIADWLNDYAHRGEIVLLYLEDELGDPAAYTQAVRVLDARLRRPDGSSLIYRPSRTQIGPKGCADLPLGISRSRVRVHGAQVVLVGDCQRGWSSDVWNWDDVHVESGSTSRYQPFPACDATYSHHVYDTKLVRYFEDSTYVSSATDPTQTPDQAHAERLTPSKVSAMSRCGVNLFGFDQILPDDGRIEASIWSWAKNKPSTRDGKCAVQQPNGRWITRHCAAKRRAACRHGRHWKLTRHQVTFSNAWSACRSAHARFDLPRTGYANSLLRRSAGKVGVWVRYRLP